MFQAVSSAARNLLNAGLKPNEEDVGRHAKADANADKRTTREVGADGDGAGISAVQGTRVRRATQQAACREPTAAVSAILAAEDLQLDAADLSCLRDREPTRYEAFERAKADTTKMVKAALHVLSEMEEAADKGRVCAGRRCLATFGFADTPRLRSQLRTGLHELARCLEIDNPSLRVATAWTVPHRSDSAERARGVSNDADALARQSEDGVQLVVTERFFDLCPVEAATSLLREFSKVFLGGADYFSVASGRECLLPRGEHRAEKSPGAQLNDVEQRLRTVSHHFAASDLSADANAREVLYAALQYEPGGEYAPERLDVQGVAERFRADASARADMNQANADSLAHLVASLANLHFRERGAAPLYGSARRNDGRA
ncbi:hypothetical protein [Chitinasiproducens palmae]|nr:hypothetical protein [Chitinasiproducens palmae]